MLATEQRRIALAALTGPRLLDALATDAGVTPDVVKEWVRTYLREKADLGPGEVRTRVRKGAEIIRDRRGVPHLFADEPYDLFYAFGYAQAQDRLWQLDYLRRMAHGRLAEVYGPAMLESDILARTIRITRVSEEILPRLGAESSLAFDAFADGVNGWLAQLPVGLPVEFAMLGYEPEPWRPVDSIAVQRRWWWYLTGRLHVLYTPELVRTGIGEGARYDAFYTPDAPVTYIVPPGAYDPTPAWPDGGVAALCDAFGGAPDAVGSNNWAVAGALTASHTAMLASDPHVYYTIPPEWYEAHLHGAGYDAVGLAYPATPGLVIGRTPDIAWGITNNICLQRDLYLERTDAAHPDAYWHDGAWVTMTTVNEQIAVQGGRPHHLTVRFTARGPVVDHLVPPEARPTQLWRGEVRGEQLLALRWVGAEMSDETQCMLDLARATTVDEARASLHDWRCPTWNLGLADSTGKIGYQCVGALPLRGRHALGYRVGEEPLDAWRGYIPFDGLPALDDPPRGWIASANNPTAPPDFPYPLGGTWTPEDRAPRIERLLAATNPQSLETFRALQTDVYSGRAARGLPALLAALGTVTTARDAAAVAALRNWDCRLTTESAAAAIYYVFFWRWHHRVVTERCTPDFAPLVVDSGWGLSSRLLHENTADWFADDGARLAAIHAAFAEALDWLTERLGPDLVVWQWGAIHQLGVRHPAARTPLQHALFDLPPLPHQGGAGTVASAHYSPPGVFGTRTGANYRFLADLGADAETRVISYPGQSGQPGSPHYADQVATYLADGYFVVPTTRAAVEAEAETRTRLVPE